MAMRSNSGTRDGRTTLLPSGTQDFFKKRGIELAGCALAVLAFALLIACLTYHPQDPSWNDATGGVVRNLLGPRSEEHTSELQSLMRISYAVFCLKKKEDAR